MDRTILIIVLGAAGGLAGSCVETKTMLDPTHCNSNDGDAFCARQHPDGSLPFCRLGTRVCDEAIGLVDFDVDGCVVERPESECYSACGGGRSILDDPECETEIETTESSDTSGSDTEGTETATEGSSGSSTSGPECMGDEDCSDAAAPFCGPIGECVSCEGVQEPDAACEGVDAARPVCDAGQCVQCAGEQAQACGGVTPVCGDDNVCVGCDEHSQCPDSACHLDGVDRGACFDVGDVVQVQTTGELTAAFAAAGPDDDVVVVLTGMNYSDVAIDFVANAEIAVLGGGNASILGNRPGGLLNLGGGAVVYFDNVVIASNSSGDGVSCSGTSVWLDDSEVRNNSQAGMDVSGGCAAHLRRTVVSTNAGGGIVANGAMSSLSIASSVVVENGDGGIVASDSSIYIENTAIGENVDTGGIAGIRITNGELWASYSSIVANLAVMDPVDSIQCFGTPAGEIRNSIVVAVAGDSAAGCGSLTWENNGLDTDLGGTNVSVGYDAGWFNPMEGDYHLTTAGETVFMDIAAWQPGDPTTDVDGDPIPTDMPSFPGYDQP